MREAVIGDDDRAPTPAELEQMKSLVAQAMKDGALGISTALIYPPGHFAKTDELIELSKVAAQYGGIYATHMRSEGASEMEALDEAIRIGREAVYPVEIFHLKVAANRAGARCRGWWRKSKPRAMRDWTFAPISIHTSRAPRRWRRHCRRGSPMAARTNCSSDCATPRRGRGSSAKWPSTTRIGKIFFSTAAAVPAC